MRVSRKLRELFDETLEQVLDELPQTVRDLLEHVPLVVEDHPNASDAEALGVDDEGLLGLYTGIPLTERSVEHVGEPPEVIRIFRAGLIAVSGNRRGTLDRERLREEIRITVMHELGHHFGLSDSRLADHGY